MAQTAATFLCTCKTPSHRTRLALEQRRGMKQGLLLTFATVPVPGSMRRSLKATEPPTSYLIAGIREHAKPTVCASCCDALFELVAAGNRAPECVFIYLFILFILGGGFFGPADALEACFGPCVVECLGLFTGSCEARCQPLCMARRAPPVPGTATRLCLFGVVPRVGVGCVAVVLEHAVQPMSHWCLALRTQLMHSCHGWCWLPCPRDLLSNPKQGNSTSPMPSTPCATWSRPCLVQPPTLSFRPSLG